MWLVSVPMVPAPQRSPAGPARRATDQYNTLVALALLVAESLPDQKTLMIRLIEHFILLKEDFGS